MESVNLFINGQPINCPSGTSILNAAKQNGIKIPTLCNHAHLKPAGACRLCIVEEEKSGRIFASCVTPAAPDMNILTDTSALKKYRTDIITLMMANHPESCIVCNQGNRCELRQVAADLGVGKIDLYPMPHYTGLEEANPFIVRDLSKCILCGKCIRADHELVVVGAIDYNLRGYKSRPTTVHSLPLEKSSCTFCGTCVSLCPTGALMTKSFGYVGSPQKESSTICGFCGVGCSLVMGSVNGQVVEVNPSHREGTVNLSTLCVRGHFAHDFLNTSARLTEPLIRRDEELLSVDWEEALDLISTRLISIKNEYGSQSIAFLGSSKCTNEENYLLQKLARVFFKTNNIDNGSYIWGRSAINSIEARLDRGDRIKPLSGLEKAEIIFVLGADPTQSVPVLAYYLKRASRMGNVPVILADPRRTAFSPFASIGLPLIPESDCDLINGLAAVLYRQKSYDEDFINQFTDGFGLYSESLASIDIDKVCRNTGLDKELLNKTASLLDGKKIAFVVGHGILQQKYGREIIDALLNLALMTGSIGGAGRGLYIINRENNQAGSWDMGAVPDHLPGRLSLADDTSRKYWERRWEAVLSPDPGLNLVRMVEEAERGNLKALYIMGENPLRCLPGTERVKKALSNLDLLIVQDILSTETAQMADIVLPGSAFSEKGGSFTNMEGRIQFFDSVVPPPGEARPDWEILDLLLEKFGNEKRYGSLNVIRQEISRLVPGYKEMERPGDELWIKETSNLRLFTGSNDGEKIPFAPIKSCEYRAPEDGFPFKAILGSKRYHLGSGTRTGHSNRIKDFAIKGEMEISPADSERLNLKEGDKVRISSPFGSISRKVIIQKDLAEGVIFVPMGFHENDAKELIDLTQLGDADSSGWKICNVKIEKE
ncbi:MAG: molybdopterin-dependent oxidoreductase [Deltaproteobacteria bacterium]|nr:molybdopterin-dependent oxidoreductase [Deltaproteobacteria bacterium]